MNLRIKFNLVIIICCAFSFLIVYLNFKTKINNNIQQEIKNKAEFILNTSSKIDQSTFNPQQSVFFAQEILSQFKTDEVKYLIAFNNAKNEQFQAKIWQQEIIDYFIKNSSKSIYSGMKSDENGEFHILSHAIKNFENSVIGAKFVLIYNRNFLEGINQDLNQFIIILLILFVSLIIIINILIHFLIIKPIKEIALQANHISHGNQVIEELAINGSDEISELSQSFNRVLRSLKTAMKLISN